MLAHRPTFLIEERDQPAARHDAGFLPLAFGADVDHRHAGNREAGQLALVISTTSARADRVVASSNRKATRRMMYSPDKAGILPSDPLSADDVPPGLREPPPMNLRHPFQLPLWTVAAPIAATILLAFAWGNAPAAYWPQSSPSA